MASEAADRVPAVVTRTGRRRQFSEEDKRLIVDAAISDGIERNAAAASPSSRPLHPFAKPAELPRWTDGDVKSFVFGRLGAVQTRLPVFPDPMKGFPDQRDLIPC